jgi:hypothetical protein
MKNLFASVVAVVLFAFPTIAQAAQMTLADLKDICSGKDAANVSACRFYILGVTEGASIGPGVAKDKNHFCIAEGVSSEEMVLIVKRMMIKDLASYPQDKDMPAVSFVGAAMMSNFPCKN